MLHYEYPSLAAIQTTSDIPLTNGGNAEVELQRFGRRSTAGLGRSRHFANVTNRA